MFRHLTRSAFVIVCVTCAACASLRHVERAADRRARFLQTVGELPPKVAQAIRDGHVIAGMTTAQVPASLGAPDFQQVFSGSPAATIWLYRGHRLHQDQLHADAKAVFRILFLDDRVAMVEGL